MKKIKINTYVWLVLCCLPFWGTAQTYMVNENHLVSSGGFLVFANSQLTNNGTIDHSAGTVKMMGDGTDANSAIGGTTAPTFNDLTINKTANNVPLQQAVTVKGILTMEGGHLDLQDVDLTATVVNGATASRYIKTSGTGQLKQEVSNSEVDFPVGNTSFNPVKMTNSGTADIIGLRVEDQLLDNLTSGAAIVDASVNRVWHTSEAIAGGSDLAVNVQWNEAEELTHFDRSQSVFTVFEGGAWTAKNAGAATGNNPYGFTGTGITTLGGFTIGNIVCETNGNAVLGIAPPVAGSDQLDICGMEVLLDATTPNGSTGQWSVSNSNGANPIFEDAMNIASSLTGVFGGLYTLRWTVTNGACATIADEVQVSFGVDEDILGGDGVQDCVDLCIGGDDRINSDGTGIPDDCDCFPGDPTNEFVEMNQTDYQALLEDVLLAGIDTFSRAVDFEFTSNAEVNAKVIGTYPTVIFKAPQSVTLTAGFHAKVGSDFIAKIDYCRNPLTGEIELFKEAPFNLPNQRVEAAASLETSLSGELDLQIHPTIIHDQAAIWMGLPSKQSIALNLYNEIGVQVRTLIRQEQRLEGKYYFRLDASQLPNGIYFLQLQGEGGIKTEKIIIAR